MKRHRCRECLPFDGPHFLNMCEKIARAYQDRHPLLVYNMHGEIFFHSELLRRAELQAEPVPIRVCRTIEGRIAQIKRDEGLLKSLAQAVRGEDVLYLDDRRITGSTIAFVRNRLLKMGARDFKSAVMLNIHGHREPNLRLGVRGANFDLIFNRPERIVRPGLDETEIDPVDGDTNRPDLPNFWGADIEIQEMN